ncbi:MAG: hypothetical protein IKA08_01220 [Alphaproteobacteria bacterium]|nr:hypothetical protein [Alphaproteobacteria bacterium]
MLSVIIPSAMIPMDVMAVSMEITCFNTAETCMAAAACTDGYYCCPTGSTGTWYICPSGCTGGGAFSTCDCGTVSNLTDDTGTYTGSSCTTTAEQITTTCFGQPTNNPSSTSGCFSCVSKG